MQKSYLVQQTTSDKFFVVPISQIRIWTHLQKYNYFMRQEQIHFGTHSTCTISGDQAPHRPPGSPWYPEHKQDLRSLPDTRTLTGDLSPCSGPPYQQLLLQSQTWEPHIGISGLYIDHHLSSNLKTKTQLHGAKCWIGANSLLLTQTCSKASNRVTFPPKYLDRYNPCSQGSKQAAQPVLSTLANAMTMLFVCFTPVRLPGTQKHTC